jgi:hypothetical protein
MEIIAENLSAYLYSLKHHVQNMEYSLAISILSVSFLGIVGKLSAVTVTALFLLELMPH